MSQVNNEKVELIKILGKDYENAFNSILMSTPTLERVATAIAGKHSDCVLGIDYCESRKSNQGDECDTGQDSYQGEKGETSAHSIRNIVFIKSDALFNDHPDVLETIRNQIHSSIDEVLCVVFLPADAVVDIVKIS